MVLVVYVWLMFRQENRDLRKASLSIPAFVLVAIVGSYLASPLFQQRVADSLLVTGGSEAAIDSASSYRLPIFKTSLNMYKAHPINGVGVRAFPTAYLEYAADDDPFMAKSDGKRGATHAHTLVLEVMADTGTIGLLGMLAGLILALRYWRGMSPSRRNEAFPFSLALVLVLFPLNSHFALFGTYMMSLIWVLFGLWASCIDNSPPEH